MSLSRDRRRILYASVSALLVAAVLLIALVLPAEYGWDPLGSGAALGLVGMAGDDSDSLRLQSEPWRTDRIVFELQPFEAVEYKYRLTAGSTLLFYWQADDEVMYDMHAEPDGSAPGYSESFSSGRLRVSGGRYSAPFDGVHGWYWQNRSVGVVEVTLETAGFYTGAIEYRDDREFHYETTVRSETSAQP